MKTETELHKGLLEWLGHDKQSAKFIVSCKDQPFNANLIRQCHDKMDSDHRGGKHLIELWFESAQRWVKINQDLEWAVRITK